MKLSGGRIDGFVAKPDPAVRAVLVYGPDAGLVRERLNALTRAIAGSVDDPFRVAEFNGETLRADPARLNDEAAALSFGGGRRVVRVRDATDGVADVFTGFMDGSIGDALVVASAGELGPRSKLRLAFEDAAAGAALPCYADDSETVERVVRAMLKEAGLTIEEDALAWLSDHLGGDRELTRREVEKLIVYRREGTVTEADVLACVGDSAALDLDDLVYAMGDGDQPMVQRVFGRLMAEGTSPVAVLTAAARHIMRLHEVRGRMAEGRSVDQAVAALRPPLFFKVRSRFQTQAGRWNETLLARGLELLTEAEISAKSRAMPAEALVERALMQLAQGARPRQTGLPKAGRN